MNVKNSDEAYVLPKLNISFLFQSLQLATIFKIQTKDFVWKNHFEQGVLDLSKSFVSFFFKLKSY